MADAVNVATMRAHELVLHLGLAKTLEAELEWLSRAIEGRLRHYFDTTMPTRPHEREPAPNLRHESDAFACAVLRHGLDDDERLVLALALAPLLRPQLLDVFGAINEATQRPFTEFGILARAGYGHAPTAETACFLLAGDDLEQRLACMRLFSANRRLAQAEIVQLGPTQPADPVLAGPLLVPQRFLADALPDLAAPSVCDADLPARRVTTGLGWHDLVLPASTLAQLDDIGLWLSHGARLLRDWEMGKRIAPGYVSLFHGPPGTGKTLSACLLGVRCGREVHRIDLSMVVSKYIGETEKNLARVFDAAEKLGWILFFDEADALFGKRTGVSDAHDRYANQEVSYLLQRIEAFDGIVILASNLRHNIDDAFLRRFHSVVHFPLPREPERLRLWHDSIPAKARLDPALDLGRLAHKYEISGGTITNVVRYAALRAIARGDCLIRADEVEEGVRRELLKDGRSL